MKGPSSSDQRLVLFENRWLEKLTVISVGWFAVTWAVLLPLIAFAGWGAVSLLSAIALVAVGWFGWSLFEYFAHRKLFHWKPDMLLLRRIVFVIHGNHHAQPRDELRNLMPPIVSVPVGALVWGLLFLLADDAGTWIFLGFISGYVAYDITHYACHHWSMRGPWGNRLKRHHMQHHFIASHQNYGVTTVFWDQLFGTRFDGTRKSRTPDSVGDEALEPAE